MIINGWFLALVLLSVLSLGISLAKHGQNREGKYNFWGSLIGAGVYIGLIYMAVVTGIS